MLMVESFWVNVWLGGWSRFTCVSTYTRFFKRFKREDVNNIFWENEPVVLRLDALTYIYGSFRFIGDDTLWQAGRQFSRI